ncbi:GntR family transcriptional regulator [Actinotignum schaalii]|uniref:GntR family transcriptional regulator n=1 Tax=Actinotignum schaalii TaxID=59505 RepID=UPI0004057DCA|nr:GntR family transcriptional regulator [Actinotignum schaalii]WQN45395.1 GntR family transcriptional regulator [Actinotignum schaalii]
MARRLADDLADHLRERILSGNIAPGERLAEAAIAEEYSVARSTARIAVESLIADGLVEREARKHPRVVTVEGSEIPEIVALLEISESLALARIMGGHPDLRPLRAARGEQPSRVLHTLVEVSGSKRLEALHRPLTFHTMLYAASRAEASRAEASRTEAARANSSRADSALAQAQDQFIDAVLLGQESAGEALRALQRARQARLGVDAGAVLAHTGGVTPQKAK